MLYLDTSAFLKLVVKETHSDVLRLELVGKRAWSSSLLGVEAHRAAQRLGVPSPVVDEFLAAVTLISLSESTMLTARTVGTQDLRTLDAIHLASALELGSDLDAMCTYDARLARASRSVGISVQSPGQAADWF